MTPFLKGFIAGGMVILGVYFGFDSWVNLKEISAMRTLVDIDLDQGRRVEEIYEKAMLYYTLRGVIPVIHQVFNSTGTATVTRIFYSVQLSNGRELIEAYLNDRKK